MTTLATDAYRTNAACTDAPHPDAKHMELRSDGSILKRVCRTPGWLARLFSAMTVGDEWMCGKCHVTWELVRHHGGVNWKKVGE